MRRVYKNVSLVRIQGLSGLFSNLTGQVMGQRQENGPHLEEQHETKQGHLAVGERM